VATETGKLINGLALDVEDDEGEGIPRGDGEEEDDDGDDVQKKTKKRVRDFEWCKGTELINFLQIQAQGNQTTLAKSFDALKVKKLDLEFTVDPLFKKTSADFDEGGAQGLLMNHLSIDGKGRVVFDSGDVEVDEEDEQLGEDGRGEVEALEDLGDLPLIEKLQGKLYWHLLAT
jgi:condensin complex subunit 2